MNANEIEVYRRLMAFFTEPPAAEQLNAEQVFWQYEVLVFSLKGLYQQLCLDDCLSFRLFKKWLYASTVNSDLAKFARKIDVYGVNSTSYPKYYQLVSL